MASIFGFILFILLLVFILGFSLITTILRALFGWRRNSSASAGKTTGNSQSGHSNNTRSNNRQTVNTDSGKKHKKVFDDNEGEYVEFEEID